MNVDRKRFGRQLAKCLPIPTFGNNRRRGCRGVGFRATPSGYEARCTVTCSSYQRCSEAALPSSAGTNQLLLLAASSSLAVDSVRLRLPCPVLFEPVKIPLRG